VLSAAALLANAEKKTAAALVLAAEDDAGQRHSLAQVADAFAGAIMLVPAPGKGRSARADCDLLIDVWPLLKSAPSVVVTEPWAEDAVAALRRRPGQNGPAAFRVQRI